MGALATGIAGVYMMIVALRGNGAPLVNSTLGNFGGFLPWTVAIVGLAIAYEVKPLQKPVQLFIVLAMIVIVLKNYQGIDNSMKQLYAALQQMSSSYASGSANVGTPSTPTKTPAKTG